MGLRRLLRTYRENIPPGWNNVWAIRNLIFERLNLFTPCSDKFYNFPQFPISGARNFPGQILALMRRFEAQDGPPEIMAVEDFGCGRDADELKELFGKYGSDKGAHGYAPVYAHILSLLPSPSPSILEIGLGSNDVRIISNMGKAGRPGASLRAFRHYLPNALVYGADIDQKILFEEERVKTAPVDQLAPESFMEMTRRLGESRFDLVIDDGLHCPEANLNTLLFALGAVKKGGYIVIEDITIQSPLVWQIVRRILPRDAYEAVILRLGVAHLFVVRVL